MKRRAYLSVLATLPIVGCTSNSNSPTKDSKNPSSTSEFSTRPSSSTFEPELEWNAVAGAKRGNGHHYPAPVVLGDTLIVPSGLNEAGLVEGFDIDTGDRRWELSFDDSMISDQPYLPTGNSTVVVATYSGLRAITEDGEIKWSEDIRPTGDLLGVNDTIFIPTNNGVEARGFDGAQKWTWKTESPVYSLGHADGSVYAKSGTSLYSIKEGEVEWEYQTTIEPSTPPVARDGLVFIGTENRRVVALNVDESTVEWEHKLENSVAAPITIGQYVYAAGWSYALKAYNPTNGEEEWSFNPTYQTISPAVEKGGTVYVGNNDYMFARDADTGEPTWSYSVDSSIWAPPAIDGDRVYVTTENGGVICLTM